MGRPICPWHGTEAICGPGWLSAATLLKKLGPICSWWLRPVPFVEASLLAARRCAEGRGRALPAHQDATCVACWARAAQGHLNAGAGHPTADVPGQHVPDPGSTRDGSVPNLDGQVCRQARPSRLRRRPPALDDSVESSCGGEAAAAPAPRTVAGAGPWVQPGGDSARPPRGRHREVRSDASTKGTGGPQARPPTNSQLRPSPCGRERSSVLTSPHGARAASQ